MTQHEGDFQIRLPHPFSTPDYGIGDAALANAEGTFQGMIIGVKLTVDRQWQYLLRSSDNLECWVAEADIIPLDSGCSYRGRWFISSQGWGKDIVYTIHDRETELTTKGLSLHCSHVEAVIAGQKFLDREFPETRLLKEVA